MPHCTLNNVVAANNLKRIDNVKYLCLFIRLEIKILNKTLRYPLTYIIIIIILFCRVSFIENISGRQD